MLRHVLRRKVLQCIPYFLILENGIVSSQMLTCLILLVSDQSGFRMLLSGT